MNINTPTDMLRVAEDKFREYLTKFPHYRRTAYIGGIVYHPRAGTYKRIGVEMDSKNPTKYYV